ncbi:MAG: phosphoglycerate dehydrogenase [Candidatus Omnitrophica bacterium]|nr:phosphoglycerate dehydrogenase [Candidatus Omnitrophota bacterium]MDD5437466.1 phosphoglycerate dehydrogenase [Candidatus Omnitrophota bacterium]
MKKIAISTTTFGEYDRSCIKRCEDLGFEVVMNRHGRKIKPDELVELAGNAVGLIAGTEELTGEVMSKLPGLKVISRCGAGIENVNLDAAKKLGIKVFNTPDAPTLAVAELAIGLIMNLLRKINMADRGIRNGEWKKPMGNLLTGKKIGIIGFGRIGKKAAELLSGFNCQVAYYDPHVEGRASGFKKLELKELLKVSDIVSIHAAAKEELLGAEELGLMKRGSLLVNLARGGAVNEGALYENLKKGILAGAALDVFGEEPYKGALKELDNVILTPHIGSYAKEARISMECEAVDNLLNGLKEGVK